jgi:hypothetical protein
MKRVMFGPVLVQLVLVQLVLVQLVLVQLVLVQLVLSFAPASAQQGAVDLTATSANVSEPGNPVRIRILRWSTNDERIPVVAALNPPTPAAAAQNPSAPAGDRGGAARGGRGAAGRGRAGRGGRGGAGAPLTPIAAFTAALGRAPTIGYLWTNDVTGYSIKYAYHSTLPDGSERIILATDRRLGAYSSAWQPAAAASITDYEFTLIEMRLGARGMGEGKTSLTTKVILDNVENGAQTVALDNYAATPAILQNIKR